MVLDALPVTACWRHEGGRTGFEVAIFEPIQTGRVFDLDERHAAAAKAVGDGALFAVAPGKGILAHREPHGVLHT